MPTCPSSCTGSLNVSGGLLRFSFVALSETAPQVRGFAADSATESVWTAADMERFTTKVQAFYDGLATDEQVVLAALLRQGGEHGPLQ